MALGQKCWSHTRTVLFRCTSGNSLVLLAFLYLICWMFIFSSQDWIIGNFQPDQKLNRARELSVIASSSPRKANDEQIKYFKPNFTISNDQICSLKDPQLLIWVFTEPLHISQRTFIRQSWGNTSSYLPVRAVLVFSLASTPYPKHQLAIEIEQKVYGDIVQDAAFADSIINRAHKAQSMLVWTNKYCQNIKILFKVDDNVVVIPERLSKWMLQLEKSWPVNSMIGDIRLSPQLRVNVQGLPAGFPVNKSCSGSGYFITADAVPSVQQAIDRVPFYSLEDVYLTGMLAQAAGLTYVNNSQVHLPETGYVNNDLKMINSKPEAFIIADIDGVNSCRYFWVKFHHVAAPVKPRPKRWHGSKQIIIRGNKV